MPPWSPIESPIGQRQAQLRWSFPKAGGVRAHVAVEDPSRTDIFNQMAVQEILDHLGLSSPQAEKPPPPPREVLRVAEHGDGRGTPQQWDPA